MFESILCEVTEYDPDVLEPLIGLAIEIAREGREGVEREDGSARCLPCEMRMPCSPDPDR
jgi:hypothetical protein